MKLIVKKGTDSYAKMQTVIDRINECKAAAQSFAKDLGFDKYYMFNEYCGTGIAAFKQNGKVPENWCRDSRGGIRPKRTKVNKELLASIAALPVVHADDLSDTVGYPHVVWGPGLTMSRGFGLIQGDGFFLLDTNDTAEWVPPADVQEILSSEYTARKKEIDAANAEKTEEASA